MFFLFVSCCVGLNVSFCAYYHRYNVWLRFDGENNRGLWEACSSNENRSSGVQVLRDARAPFCERELYAHGANEDMADFENFEPQNLAGAKEHQQVVAALHATARAFFDPHQQRDRGRSEMGNWMWIWRVLSGISAK